MYSRVLLLDSDGQGLLIPHCDTVRDLEFFSRAAVSLVVAGSEGLTGPVDSA